MDKPDVRKLPVRVRRTLQADGEESTARTVLCPTHAHAVALSTCAECPLCQMISGADGCTNVTCAPVAPKPTMRWTAMLHRILPSAADRIAIAEVMQRDVRCVTRDVKNSTLTDLFLDASISAAPVVDEEGYPIGMVSKTDLLRDPGFVLVEDIMMSIAFTLAEDEPLSRAAAVMDVEGVHHLPIVCSEGRVVGILSSLDIVRWVAHQSAFADQV